MSTLKFITQESLKEWFEYHPDGYFVYKKHAFDSGKVGQRATQKSLTTKGYKRVSILGARMREHRAIYLWHHGFLPEIIDHINGCKTDNRIENLRRATNSQNLCNRGAPVTSTTGHKGITFRKGKYDVKVMKNYTPHKIGRFKDLQDAIKAHADAVAFIHEDFSRSN
jgi:hypothetical protein